MTNDQRTMIATQFAGLAEYYDQKLSPIAIEINVNGLEDLDFDKVLHTLIEWPKRNRQFPRLVDIREKVLPEVSAQDEAQDVSNSILAAISTCGYTNPERARQKIGELGWEVVKRMGGWIHLCEVVTHDNETIYRAQIRAYTETVNKKALRGELDERPSLPGHETQKQIEVKNVVTHVMKSMPND